MSASVHEAPCRGCGVVLPVTTAMCPECLQKPFSDETSQPPEPGDVPPDAWRCACGRDEVDGPWCPDCGSARPRASAPRVAAVVVLPNGTVVRVTEGQRLMLGREVDNPLVNSGLASYAGVSRRHASVQVADGRVTVEDAESLNGTFVNGRQIERLAPRAVDDEAAIRLGQYAVVHLRVEVEKEATR